MTKRILALFLTLIIAFVPLTGCSDEATAAIGIIGGADGPSSILVASEQDSNTASDSDANTASEDIIATETILAGNIIIDEEGWYSEKEEVALYLMTYHSLPSNYITKKEAQALGWQGGSLEAFSPGMSIGGDHFGNYEGALPEDANRTYTECDIDTQNAIERGAKRIVFSNDGLIFYTEDHYETFVQLLMGE